jgi:S1-C subfamily serine protease
MRRFYTFGPALLVLLAVTLALFAAPAAVRKVQFARISAQVTQAQAILERGSILEQINQQTTAISEAVLPSVVHLEVQFRPSSESGIRRPRFSSGSGWVWSEDGYIVTNSHVVSGASRITAELFDGRVERATLVGTDPQTDIAVLRVDEGVGLIPLERATDEVLQIGEQVFAFGSPFSIKFSMSRGIVSGLGRSEAANFLNMIGGYTNFIQTDAAMNPGNSGGPLVDVNGRLVGMSAAIANNVSDGPGPQLQGQSAGIGFAIPLETIEAVVTQLVDAEIVLRGYLGINLNTRAEPREYGFEGRGVIVGGIPEGQPADKAGLRFGDVIYEIDGVEITAVDVLRSVVSVRRPGDRVEVLYWRPDDDGGGSYEQTVVQLGAAYSLGRGLAYVPNSEEMSAMEIRRWIERNGAAE